MTEVTIEALDPDEVEIDFTFADLTATSQAISIDISTVELVTDAQGSVPDLVISPVTTFVAVGQEVVTVELAASGVQGPAGARGPAGDGHVLTYALVSVSSYSAAHDFAYPPAARLYDATGAEVLTDVTQADPAHVYLTFPSPFTGTLVLS